jgi:hypothetical protein
MMWWLRDVNNQKQVSDGGGATYIYVPCAKKCTSRLTLLDPPSRARTAQTANP